jgi:hypothetical protein
VVRSVAESFTSLMNYRGDDYVMGHLVSAAWVSGARELRVNLLTGATNASPLLVPDVQASVSSYVEWFPDTVRRSRSDLSLVAEADLVVTVEPGIRRAHDNSGLVESPFTCTVRIIDDKGREYSHRVDGWWYPEKTVVAKPWWRFW